MKHVGFAVPLAAAFALGGCIAVDEVQGRRLDLPEYDGIFKCDSSDVSTLDDGHETRVVHLDRPFYGLLVVPGIWCRLENSMLQAFVSSAHSP